MYCTSCGINNEDGAAFCANCGAKLEQSATPAPVAETPTAADILVESPEGARQGDTAQTEQPVPPPAPIYLPPTYNAVIGTVKKMGTSGKFKSIAILFSVIAGLIVVAEFMSAFVIPTVYSALPAYGDEMQLEVTTAFPSFPSATTILTIVGLWLVYAACKKPENAVKTGGLMVLKVVSILQLVGAWLAAAAGCIVLLAFSLVPELKNMLETANSELTPIDASINATQILAVAGAFFIAVMAVTILFCFKKLQTVNAVLDSVRTGIPSQKASSFYGAMLYVGGAVLTVLGLIAIVVGFGAAILLRSHVSPSVFELVMVVCAAVMFANAAFNFILGSLVFEFRSEMKNIKSLSDTAVIQD